MKITGLKLENWMIHRFLEIDIKPLTIIAGPNESGKSAIADAIDFALFNGLRRVSTKGERPDLISEGAHKGSVTIYAGDKSARRDIASGKLASKEMMPIREGAVSKAMPYLLDIHLFGRAPADEKRAILSMVMKASFDPAALLEEMKKRGAPASVIGALPADEPLDKWQAIAKEQASQARGAWKQITGEAYGAVKAETWEAQAPASVEGDEESLQTEVRAARVAMSNASGAVAAHDARQREIASYTCQTEEMEEKAAKLGTAMQEVARLEEELSSTNMTLAKERAKSPPLGAQETVACPSCGSILTFSDSGDLEEAKTHKSAEETAAEGVVARLNCELERAKGTLHAAEVAEEALRASAGRVPIQICGDLAELQAADGAATAAHEQAQAALRQYQESKRAADTAAKATKDAKAKHELVGLWTKAEEWLAPGGIPAQLLAKALQPFNATLSKLSARAGWKIVTLNEGMGITVGGRPYGLHSESGQWRADVIMAAALAIHSDLRMAIIDRFDVLESAARAPAMIFLRSLVKDDAPDLDTIIVMGTFKEPPRAPAGVAVHWLGAPT